jgi:hypothetical protein
LRARDLKEVFIDEPTRSRIRHIFLSPRPNFALMTAADLLGFTLEELKRESRREPSRSSHCRRTRWISIGWSGAARRGQAPRRNDPLGLLKALTLAGEAGSRS